VNTIVKQCYGIEKMSGFVVEKLKKKSGKLRSKG
jgi:hypothetical protein